MQASIKPPVVTSSRVPKAQEGLVAGQGHLEDVHSDGLGVDNLPLKAVQVAGQGNVEDFHRDGHDDVGGIVSEFVPFTNSRGVRFTR